MKKKIYFVCVLCLILLIIFFVFNYKKNIIGNNIINKSYEEIVEYILNELEEYEAIINITVTTNKNENTYDIKQTVTKSFSKQEILGPDNIKGLTTILENNSLKISNTNLKLEKIYNNYESLLNNALFLNVFINDCKENKFESYEENEEIILEIEITKNAGTYIKYKKLYIDKETGKPKKLEIKDNTKKMRICIIYNDIEIK